MQTIIKINRQTAQYITNELLQAAQVRAQELGLSLDNRGCSFDAMQLKWRVEVRVTDERAVAADFARWAQMYDLPADLLGNTVTMRGRTFTVTGFDPAAPRNKVLLSANGSTYKAPPFAIRRALGIAEKFGGAQ